MLSDLVWARILTWVGVILNWGCIVAISRLYLPTDQNGIVITDIPYRTLFFDCLVWRDLIMFKVLVDVFHLLLPADAHESEAGKCDEPHEVYSILVVKMTREDILNEMFERQVP